MLDLATNGRAQIPDLSQDLMKKGNEIMDIDVCANAALKRLHTWIERSAAQRIRRYREYWARQ